MNLQGRTALVTGATGGLGHAIARALAARGAKLLLTGRRSDVLDPLAGELGARSLAVDLADRGALERLIADAAAIDVLANAALPGTSRITDLDVDVIDRTLDVNLRAPILLARALAPRMAERGSGPIYAVAAWACPRSFPVSSATPGCSPRAERNFRLESAPVRPTTWPPPSSERSRGTWARSTWLRSPLGSAP
jgi:NAD(P)-dependent dehydrogenase (short-subunit alcohol dehydrogenase family)